MKTKNSLRAVMALPLVVISSTLGNDVSIDSDGTPPFAAGSTVTLSVSGGPPEPGGDCCDNSNWTEGGDPTYDWGDDASGSGSTATLDTTLDDPMVKDEKSASVTVTQPWKCDDGSSGSTDASASAGPWEVWPTCGEEMFDSDKMCCVDGVVIEHEPLTNPPIIQPPFNSGKLPKSFEFEPEPERDLITRDVPQVYRGGTVIFSKYTEYTFFTSSAVAETVVEYTHGPVTDTQSVSSCGAGLNEQIEKGSDVGVSLSFDAKVELWGAVDVGPSIDLGRVNILRSTKTNCTASASENEWPYYRIFDIYTEVTGIDCKITGSESEEIIYVYEGGEVYGDYTPPFGYIIMPGKPSHESVSYGNSDATEDATQARKKSGNQLCKVEIVSCCDGI